MEDDKIKKNWEKIYKKNYNYKLYELMEILNEFKNNNHKEEYENKLWYKNSVIYSLYVDFFSRDFKGLVERLDYLKKLGVNALWILPILDSPMKDQGFDIRDYYKVREELGGTEQFIEFINEAHKKGIRIIFDVALNHTSSEHIWFQDARENKYSPYRDYYLWENDDKKYSKARLLFKGIVDSNWSYNPQTMDYYFHRFYFFQPDLNYKNPNVIMEMIKIILFWKEKGIDGFRLDAIPFLWKKEGTSCENLKETHYIIKLLRAVIDYVDESTLLIAEANLKPKKVVDYFGKGDECHSAYHFPLMTRFYLALSEKNYEYIEKTLSEDITPDIPENCQWLTFLRCHDELTLEFVSEKERENINSYYLKDNNWRFREGEGISSRLYSLMEGNTDKILLMYSMLFSLNGTPIIYYGDELGMDNDIQYFYETSSKTGYLDSRFLNRGYVKWEIIQEELKNKESKSYIIFEGIKKLINLRKEYINFFEKKHILIIEKDKSIYRVKREYQNKSIEIIMNLADKEKYINIDEERINLINNEKINKGKMKLNPYEYIWTLSLN